MDAVAGSGLIIAALQKCEIYPPVVLVETGGAVVGYNTLSALALLLTELPLEDQKKLPRYPSVPVTLLDR